MNNIMQHMRPAPINGGFKMEGYWVWCPSVIKGEDDRYHMFASRWSKKLPMHPGWLFESEVVRAVSDVPEGPYEFQEVVLPARGPQYWDGRTTHNPQIHKIGSQYVLYYMGSTHPFKNLTLEEDGCISNDSLKTIVARSNKRIGIAVSDSINGPWKRFDTPILEPRPEFYDNMMVSNPSVAILPDNSVRMLYKSRGYLQDLTQKFLHSQMSIGLAGADKALGQYNALTNHAVFGQGNYEVEDPFLWYEDGMYQMICKDMSGNICGEKYGGVYGCSKDGVNWDIDKDNPAYSRNIMWDNGQKILMGNLDRPFILFENGKATHIFFATSDGTGDNSFRDAKNTWNMVVPLK